ncbi:MAG: FAD:protein FMN transferase [Alphaproteobacteria bacterium]|nr:FAD:protein FMN transferase [Alphaproteobacteria bacterium]
MRILAFFALFIFFAGLIFSESKKNNPYQTLNGKIFGTYYTVKIRTDKKDTRLPKIISNELNNVNSQMSVFDLSSEISQINNSPANQWIELSKDMQYILKNSYNIYKISDGAFDPTAGKLIDLWGFGTKGRIEKEPNEADIYDTLSLTGFDKIEFSEDFSRLKKQFDDVTINLSAIAKGYGVDKLSELLKGLGYNDFIIEIGGEVIAYGNKSDKIKGWNIGIVKPSEKSNETAFIVGIKDYAVATSGDYRNFFYVGEKKYSHTIDTRTGYPVKNNLLSVTVFHQKCMIADGLATAIMSMGEKEGLEFAEFNDLAVFMFVKTEDNKIKNIVSNKAKKLIEQ